MSVEGGLPLDEVVYMAEINISVDVHLRRSVQEVRDE